MQKIAICLLLSISIIIGVTSCAADDVGAISSAPTESDKGTQNDVLTSSEKDETSSKVTTTSQSKEESSQKVENSSEENSSKESSSNKKPNRVSSNKENNKTEDKKVFKSLTQLWSANVKAGETITLDIDEYCKGEY